MKMYDGDFVDEIIKIMERYINTKQRDIDYIKTSEELFEFVYETLYGE